MVDNSQIFNEDTFNEESALVENLHETRKERHFVCRYVISEFIHTIILTQQNSQPTYMSLSVQLENFCISVKTVSFSLIIFFLRN